jgi:hypothetical protein
MVWPELQRNASTRWLLQTGLACVTAEHPSPTIDPIPVEEEGDETEKEGCDAIPFQRLLGRARVAVEAMQLCRDGAVLLGLHNGGMEMWDVSGETIRVLDGHAAR